MSDKILNGTGTALSTPADESAERAMHFNPESEEVGQVLLAKGNDDKKKESETSEDTGSLVYLLANFKKFFDAENYVEKLKLMNEHFIEMQHTDDFNTIFHPVNKEGENLYKLYCSAAEDIIKKRKEDPGEIHTANELQVKENIRKIITDDFGEAGNFNEKDDSGKSMLESSFDRLDRTLFLALGNLEFPFIYCYYVDKRRKRKNNDARMEFPKNIRGVTLDDFEESNDILVLVNVELPDFLHTYYHEAIHVMSVRKLTNYGLGEGFAEFLADRICKKLNLERVQTGVSYFVLVESLRIFFDEAVKDLNSVSEIIVNLLQGKDEQAIFKPATRIEEDNLKNFLEEIAIAHSTGKNRMTRKYANEIRAILGIKQIP